MTLTSWVSLAAVCIAGAMSPGPSLAVVARHTLVNSRAHGMATALAHALGIGFYALLTSFGLAVVVAHNPTIYRALTIGGALYLAWLGIKALRSSGEAAAFASADERPASIAAAARDGFLISILNPKIAVFFLALFSQFVRPGMSEGEHAILWATAAGIDGIWYAVVALALSQAALLERFRRRTRLIDRITGCILLALAVRVVTL
ncbi:LysE family translocator [Rhodospirillaceae bacterium SYSU D60014]|uniref:LysE family translocator n=1 Tax=Virgifigura deserti TaxID=2268457 RepID=UPI000E666798